MNEETEIPSAPSPASETIALPKSRFYALVLGWPVLCAALTVAFGLHQTRAINAELSRRPPIAVIAVNDAVLAKVGHGESVKTLDNAIQDVRAAATRLKDNGYLVLDAGKVYAYPTDFEAKP